MELPNKFIAASRVALTLLVLLVLCAFDEAQAAPSPWKGTTAIVVTGSSSAQISVSAPVSVPLALRSDGGVLDGSAVELRNLSSSPVAVTNVSVQERNGAHVVRTSEVDALSLSDMLHMTFTTPESAGIDAYDCLGDGIAPTDQQHWRADPKKTLVIAVDGGFENPSDMFASTYRDASPVTAAVVVWTVEAV